MSTLLDVPARPSHPSPVRRELIAWSACTAVLIASVVSHEMWRDEVQAWAIARASSGPGELIDNLAWERHPPLWHAVLWVVSRGWAAPGAAHVVGLVIGATTLWLLIARPPWPFWVRVAVATGYYPMYELGTIARSWGLVALLVVLVLVEADRDAPRRWLLVALLLAVCFAELHAVPLAVALGATIVVPMSSARERVAVLSLAAISLALLAAVLPAPNGRDTDRVQLLPGAEFLRRLPAGAMVRALFPVSEFRVESWGRVLLAQIPVVAALVSLVAIAAVTLLAASDRLVLVQWLVSFGGLIYLVAALELPMGMRHASVLWLSVLAVFWRLDRRSLPVEGRLLQRTQRPARVVMIAALGASTFAAAWAIAVDLRRPFSAGEAIAGWVEERADGEVVVFCSGSTAMCSSVSIRLDTTSHMSADDPGSEFNRPDGSREHLLAPEDVVAEARRLAERTGADVVVIQMVGNEPAVGCTDGWSSETPVISKENMTACMVDDLIDVTVR